MGKLKWKMNSNALILAFPAKTKTSLRWLLVARGGADGLGGLAVEIAKARLVLHNRSHLRFVR